MSARGARALYCMVSWSGAISQPDARLSENDDWAICVFFYGRQCCLLPSWNLTWAPWAIPNGPMLRGPSQLPYPYKPKRSGHPAARRCEDSAPDAECPVPRDGRVSIASGAAASQPQRKPPRPRYCLHAAHSAYAHGSFVELRFVASRCGHHV